MSAKKKGAVAPKPAAVRVGILTVSDRLSGFRAEGRGLSGGGPVAPALREGSSPRIVAAP